MSAPTTVRQTLLDQPAEDRIAGRTTLLQYADRLANPSRHAHRSDSFAEDVRRSIAKGGDLLGENYSRLVPPDVRREQGVTFTPSAVVQAMLEWACSQGVSFARVVDPGAGTGRFVLAAARSFPHAEIVAVEKDPEIARLLRANIAAAGITGRVRIYVQDYRSLKLPRIPGPTLFVGNPPYVRHHDIEIRWKDWYARTLKAYGLPGSRLAGLHLHFFLKTKQLAVPGDMGCFITAAEWLDTNYGSAARAMLTNGMGGQAIHLIDKRVKVFEDALTSAAITCFAIGRCGEWLRVRQVRSVPELGDLRGGARVRLSRAEATERWSTLVGQTRHSVGSTVELGELFDVHRGQVTGMNRVWIAGDAAKGLPRHVLCPTITDAKELISAPSNRLMSTAELCRVVDLPADLDKFDDKVRHNIECFLRWARSQGAHKTYVAQHRKPWWRVNLRPAAPIVMTYMARRPPVFVRNLCGAHLLNIAHGLYPRVPISDMDLDRIIRWLNVNVSTSAGRTYAGGLTKFEPGEVSRLRIPDLCELREMESA